MALRVLALAVGRVGKPDRRRSGRSSGHNRRSRSNLRRHRTCIASPVELLNHHGGLLRLTCSALDSPNGGRFQAWSDRGRLRRAHRLPMAVQRKVVATSKRVHVQADQAPQDHARSDELRVGQTRCERLADPTAKSIGEAGPQFNEVELALRAMARENRFSRRLLGRGVREFVQQATTGKLRSRSLTGPGGIIYVFVFFASDEEASYRIAELINRCFIARHKVGVGDIVTGVGISRYAPLSGSTSDLVYLNLPDWSAADDETAIRMKADLRFFDGTSTQRLHEDEHPSQT